MPGHLTASALVLDATGERTLLTLHKRVPPVGPARRALRAAATRRLRAAALREATEESGIDGPDDLGREPLHLDVHPVTCSLGVPTRHLDVRYLVRAPAGAEPRISDESADLRWWPVDALPSDEPTLTTMVTAARRTARCSR